MKFLVEAGTEMTRDVIDSIAEYLDGDLTNLYTHQTIMRWLQNLLFFKNSRLLHQMIQIVWLQFVGNANPDDKVRALTTADILAEMSYFLNLAEGIGKVDDIDHLGNRRIRAVGEIAC